jgi:dolichol-phosphate mannosyltransferase
VSNNKLIILPTYNERRNLSKTLGGILNAGDFSVLIIDDNSPDGTGDLAEEWAKKSNRVFLIRRPSKLGLGSAYVTGFKWGLELDYDYFYEMDADGSHNPEALPWFVKEMERGYDLVIGSRYIAGKISVVGWDFRRLLLSKIGNLYASRILGLRLTDLTSGFRCYSRQALKAIDLDRIYSNGYAFQIEMAYHVTRAGFEVGEMPIIFYERNSGSSKMSKKIVREGVIIPWRLRMREIKDFVSKIFFKKKYVKEISN